MENVYDKLEGDLERYSLIVNYFRRNPSRIEENRDYFREIFKSLRELSSGEVPFFLSDRSKKLENTIRYILSSNFIKKLGNKRNANMFDLKREIEYLKSFDFKSEDLEKC